MVDNKQNALTALISYALIALGVIYTLLIIWGVLTSDPITHVIGDNIRILMEIATMLSAIAFLLFTISIHYFEEPKGQVYSFISIIFMSIMVALTCSVHFISITVATEIISVNKSLASLVSLGWPSVLLSIDILAWDVFFGLAFLILGIGFMKDQKKKTTGILMILSGAFSLLGLIALPMQNMNVRYVGVFGYTVLPLAACISFIFYFKNRTKAIDK